EFSRISFFRGQIYLFLSASLLSARTLLQAGDFALDSAGVRFGFPVDDRSREFYQTEGFINWNLHLDWEFASAWRLQSRLDLASGWLRGHSEDAFIVSIGPSLALQ